MRLLRLTKIIIIFYSYGLLDIIQENFGGKAFIIFIKLLGLFIPKKHKKLARPQRLYLALEYLGPVFVKFGQLLSTRPDLLSDEYIIELSKLQSQVAPFDGKIAKDIIQQTIKTNIENMFSEFSEIPIASASIAQVHKAKLIKEDAYVAIKVIRPNIRKVIKQDIQVLYMLAHIAEKISRDGRRLRLIQVVDEFKKTINAELDFRQEAANAIELKYLHRHDPKILIPYVYFDYSSKEVLILEWMDGIPILNIPELLANNIDLKQLAHNGVTIFYNQVFNYGFFHADMHPGNVQCDKRGKYIALDFGIVGALSQYDKRYLAINILAFFNRDYKRVAVTHIESGWAPKDTSVEELENAIRSVCEPIFHKPLSQISFGLVLFKLFQVSRRFNISIQPQLVLLQKTIINVEGLGRVLYPDLDLWVTAKPILEKWMNEQMGLRGLIKNFKSELPYFSYMLPSLPRDFMNSLVKSETTKEHYANVERYIKTTNRQNNLLIIIIITLIIIICLNIYKV